jgi:serine phosphatase RsbU (regulator of sigma subunit)
VTQSPTTGTRNRDNSSQKQGERGELRPSGRRADSRLSEQRVLEAAGRLLAQSPSATISEISAAAGVSRSTFYRHFGDRESLLRALAEHPDENAAPGVDEALPPGRLGRSGGVVLDAIQVLDAVPPALLPGQLVAEAQRMAGVPVALYVLDIDGSHLLHMAGPKRLGDQLEAPQAIGPELDAAGVASLRHGLTRYPGVELFALWLRGRAIGALIAFGRPRAPLTELARQATAAITLADRYTDVFARAQRSKQPRAAAEIQQSLLPPRISRISGGEVAGNVLPSYEVAGDWFDVVENSDGVWCSLADGLGPSTRAAAASAVALGALRASRRSGASMGESLLVMHQTLSELPGPKAEMTAALAHWDPTTYELRICNCGHVAPMIFRVGGEAETLHFAESHGLGGRPTPKPSEHRSRLLPGDRLLMVSDGVVSQRDGGVGLSPGALIAAASRSQQSSASDTVREVHRAVLAGSPKDGLADDATALCLATG